MTVIDNLCEGSYEKINAWSVTRVFDLLMTHNNNAVYNIHDVLWRGKLLAFFDQRQASIVGKQPIRGCC